MFGLREPNIKSHSHFQGDPIYFFYDTILLKIEAVGATHYQSGSLH